MTINTLTTSYASSADRLDLVQEDAALKKAQIQQYFVTSNAISLLFNSADGIVSNASAPQTSTINGTPSTAAVSPVTNTTTLTTVQADLQAAGWMAYLDQMIAHLPDPAAAKMISFIRAKLVALQQSGKLSDMTTLVQSAIDIIDGKGTTKTVKTDWSNFWVFNAAKTGALNTIDTDLVKWEDSMQIDAADDDTLFATIMLCSDLGQNTQAGQLSGFANLVFDYSCGGGKGKAYALYSRFVALYLYNNMKGVDLDAAGLDTIVGFMDPGTESKTSALYYFFHGDGASYGIQAMIDAATKPGSSGWDSTDYGSPTAIDIDAHKTWNRFVN